MSTKKAIRKVTKAKLVSVIIKIRCVLKIVNSQDEFELNLGWRLLMTVKKHNLLRMYQDDLNTLFRYYGSDLTRIPKPVFQECFILPVVYTNRNKLEVCSNERKN